MQRKILDILSILFIVSFIVIFYFWLPHGAFTGGNLNPFGGVLWILWFLVVFLAIVTLIDTIKARKNPKPPVPTKTNNIKAITSLVIVAAIGIIYWFIM